MPKKTMLDKPIPTTKKERVAVIGQDLADLVANWIGEGIIVPKNERRVRKILALAQIGLEAFVPDDDEEE